MHAHTEAMHHFSLAYLLFAQLMTSHDNFQTNHQKIEKQSSVLLILCEGDPPVTSARILLTKGSNYGVMLSSWIQKGLSGDLLSTMRQFRSSVQQVAGLHRAMHNSAIWIHTFMAEGMIYRLNIGFGEVFSAVVSRETISSLSSMASTELTLDLNLTITGSTLGTALPPKCESVLEVSVVINHLHAELLLINRKVYFHLVLFLHTEMIQVVQNLNKYTAWTRGDLVLARC